MSLIHKRKSDENEELAGGGKSKRPATRKSNANRDSSCKIIWDVAHDSAKAVLQDLGVNFLPVLAKNARSPLTPINSSAFNDSPPDSNSWKSDLRRDTRLTPTLTLGKLIPLTDGDKTVKSDCREISDNQEKKVTINCLSDELLLHMFSLLPKRTLASRCALVCKKWHRISFDKSLWKTVDLSKKHMDSKDLATILEKGVKAAKLTGIIVKGVSPFNMTMTLKYLDMSMAFVEVDTLNAILGSNEDGKSLKKLSLEGLEVNQETFNLICKRHQKLEVLNMTLCRLSNADNCFTQALPHRLKELNVGWINGFNLPKLVEHLPDTIERLNLSGGRNMLDIHVDQLTKKCPDIKELDLSDSHQLTSKSLSDIKDNLNQLEFLLISRCFHMTDFSDIMEMSSLQTLSAYGLMLPDEVQMSALNIDVTPLSTIARPTVGNRRTSIWGIRFQQ